MNTPKRSDGWHAIEADHFLRPAADGGQYFSADVYRSRYHGGRKSPGGRCPGGFRHH